MNIRDTIAAFIHDELLEGPHVVGDDDMLLNDGVVDSLGMVRLVGYLEETYGFEIPPQDFSIEYFRSINTIAAYVAQRSHD